MPPKRSSSGTAQQSKLAFHGASNKVTKAGARTQNAKNIIADTKIQKAKPEVIDLESETPTTAEAAIIEQTEKEVKAQEVESTPEEDEARKLSAAAIKKYWTAKEKERMAPRVHQQDLSLHEKILRDFDMSAHYGPCTGIARLKRWKRAHGLDLDPPIEVLAVLLKEQETGDRVAVQRSHVDELLNSKADVQV